jgi:hypothetical protein
MGGKGACQAGGQQQSGKPVHIYSVFNAQSYLCQCEYRAVLGNIYYGYLRQFPLLLQIGLFANRIT